VEVGRKSFLAFDTNKLGRNRGTGCRPMWTANGLRFVRWLVAQGGQEVYFECQGTRDIEDRASPFTRDTNRPHLIR